VEELRTDICKYSEVELLAFSVHVWEVPYLIQSQGNGYYCLRLTRFSLVFLGKYRNNSFKYATGASLHILPIIIVNQAG
jgi:hypothetical protein